MDDSIAGAAAPNATPTSATPAAVAPPAANATPAPAAGNPAPVPAATSKPDQVEMPRAAFNERLQREREAGTKSLLDQLGVNDPAVLKSLIDEHKAREEAKKSIEEKAATTAAQLEAERQDKARLLSVVKERVDVEFGLLSEAQKSAVIKLAGDDPEKRLRAIDALWPTWQNETKPTPTPTPAADDKTPAPPPPPAKDTAPRAAAPADDGKTVSTDPRGEYERVGKENPFAAALHGHRHAREVYVRKS